MLTPLYAALLGIAEKVYMAGALRGGKVHDQPFG
jgi:hypothetical protein